MRGESLGKAPHLGRCAPSHTAQHGPGGGQAAIRIDDAAIPKHALIPKALLRRLCPLLLPLLAMSVDAKLDVFPGEKPQAGDVLDWVRLNKPRLSSDQRALADGYTPRALLAYAALLQQCPLFLSLMPQQASRLRW